MNKMVKVIVNIYGSLIGKLDEITSQGLASGGHWQDFRFVVIKALEEFVKKYEEKD